MISKLKHLLIFLCVILLSIPETFSQEISKEERLQWFKDAKLGIFIHWGIYAVDGIDESWSFHNGKISHKDYMKQLKGFTASNYNPEEWAKLIKESGATYTVITSKHHDGVALWDSKYSKLDVFDKTPAKRDLLKPFEEAIRNEGLKFGLYYSLIDWSNDNYPNFLRNEKRYENDEKRWQKFVTFNFNQIGEITENYKPDLVWFDGDWEFNAEQWKAKEIRELLLTKLPTTIINSRLQGYGDYATPEQGLPIVKPESNYWELCLTMNDSWGYQGRDTNYKSVNQIIRILVDCISMGGNLLLDIGPKADGTIPEEQVKILKGLGRWTSKHKEAIYGTLAGIPHGHFYGPTALSKDKKTLYLYIDNKPNGTIAIKGLNNNVVKAYVVGSGTELNTKVVGKLSWSKVPGILYTDIPESELDSDVTVIALQLDSEVSLYREDVKAIESN
ncbi:MAG: alpha-L-fucosidase [Flavobacteriaceae bacterium]